jgi:alkylhydroperoxidase/carboxymuconolactone decarboxylase family protein YurZ
MAPSARVRDLLDQLAGAAQDDPSDTGTSVGYPGLDARTRALVIIGATVCMDSPTSELEVCVSSAKAAGATDEEILGALFAVAPAVGESQLVTMTPRVSEALGYDIDEAFENG